jgi:hypothetical protein
MFWIWIREGIPRDGHCEMGEAESVLTLYFWPGCLGRTIPSPPQRKYWGGALHDFQVPCNVPQSTFLLPAFLIVQRHDDEEEAKEHLTSPQPSAITSSSISTIIHRDATKNPL